MEEGRGGVGGRTSMPCLAASEPGVTCAAANPPPPPMFTTSAGARRTADVYYGHRLPSVATALPCLLEGSNPPLPPSRPGPGVPSTPRARSFPSRSAAAASANRSERRPAKGFRCPSP